MNIMLPVTNMLRSLNLSTVNVVFNGKKNLMRDTRLCRTGFRNDFFGTRINDAYPSMLFRVFTDSSN